MTLKSDFGVIYGVRIFLFFSELFGIANDKDILVVDHMFGHNDVVYCVINLSNWFMIGRWIPYFIFSMLCIPLGWVREVKISSVGFL